jgi:hypothetical protein
MSRFNEVSKLELSRPLSTRLIEFSSPPPKRIFRSKNRTQRHLNELRHSGGIAQRRILQRPKSENVVIDKSLKLQGRRL